MAKPLDILVVIESSRTYGRQLLRGIAQYALVNGPWQIERQAPFYLQQFHAMGKFPLERAMKADGVIMREQANVDPLIDSGVPVVFASYLSREFEVPTIRTDDRQISMTAATYYLERGFKNFAFVGYDGMFWSDSRKAEFAEALKDKDVRLELYQQPKQKMKRVWERERVTLSQWLKALPKPVAIMTCNDDRAVQVLESCRLEEIAVPEEVAILGVDNDEFVCSLPHPALSSISLSTAIAGFEAASVLHRMILGEKLGKIVIPVHVNNVVTRQSSDLLAIEDESVAQAVKFIRDHIREPIQVEDILDHIAISRRSLYDKFKQSMNCSVHKYIKKSRIDRIEALLIGTEMTISQIAYHMGFRSDEHIASYFRSVKGVNPRAFRNSRKL